LGLAVWGLTQGVIIKEETFAERLTKANQVEVSDTFV